MKNVIFISPNFPENYWHFCHELKENGIPTIQNKNNIGFIPTEYLTDSHDEIINLYLPNIDLKLFFNNYWALLTKIY